ncbi:hypothetical protein Fcan01_19130, partial [Folsomia candida]
MPTPLIWKVLNSNFLSNRYLSKMPITFEYNYVSQHKFHFEKVSKSNYRKLLLWIFNVYFLPTIVTMGCCGYVIGRHASHPVPNVTTVHVLIYLIITPALFLTAAISKFVIYNGEIATVRLNCLMKVFDEIDHLNSNMHGRSRKIIKHSIWKSSNGELDYFVRLLNVGLPVLFYSIFPMSAFTSLLVIQQMLSVAVGVDEKASKAVKKWMVGLNTANLSGTEKKCWHRKFKALRTI